MCELPAESEHRTPGSMSHFIANLCLAGRKPQVEKLTRDVHASKQGVTIVQQGDRSGSSMVLYSAAAIGMSTVLYFTVVRGWSLADMFYVTRRSFKQGVTSLSQGIVALSQRLNEVKQRLEARMAELSHKQDRTIHAQQEMQAQLAAVGQDVEVTRHQVGQVGMGWGRGGKQCPCVYAGTMLGWFCKRVLNVAMPSAMNLPCHLSHCLSCHGVICRFMVQ
jgi:hypothetical protein